MADEEGKVTPAPVEEAEKEAPAEEPAPEQQTQEAEQESQEAPQEPEQATEGEVPPTEGVAEVKDDEPTGEATTEGAGGAGKAAPADKPVDGEEDAPATVKEEEGGDAAPPEEKKSDSGEDEAKPEEVEELKEEVEEGLKEENDEKEEGPPLPQSEDFAAGELPEEALEVSAEVLSRGGTPVVPPDGLPEDDMIQPGTPDREMDERGVIFEEEEEEEEIIPKMTREELVERYHAALQEREMLNQKNHALQHKLGEYFRKKRTEESRQEVDRNVTDQEQRYLKYMSNLEELRQQEAAERESYNEQIEEMKERKAAKQVLVEEEWKQYCDFKRSVALSSVNSRSGRPLTLKEFEIYEINEIKKEAEVSQVRLENIKLRNRLRKREMQLKQKEELAEGLHLIDFEQLKIENQTYNEKIEERNEELMKLRKKITSTVQVLTHLKEKLQFVQGENQVARQELAHTEAEVAAKRDILSRTKQARDALRHDNSKLQQKCGLLGNRLLLRDYEEGTDEISDLSHRLDQLKRTHAELTLSISGVKKKIEQARAQAQN